MDLVGRREGDGWVVILVIVVIVVIVGPENTVAQQPGARAVMAVVMM